MSKHRAAVRRSVTSTLDTLTRVGVIAPVMRRLSLAGTVRLATEHFASAASALTGRVRP